jgi:hypothetical protein
MSHIQLTAAQATTVHTLACAFGHGWATALPRDEAVARLTMGASVAPSDPEALQGPCACIEGGDTVIHTSGTGSVLWTVPPSGQPTVWVGYYLDTDEEEVCAVFHGGAWALEGTPPDDARGERGSAPYLAAIVRQVSEALGVEPPDLSAWPTGLWEVAQGMHDLLRYCLDQDLPCGHPLREAADRIGRGLSRARD